MTKEELALKMNLCEIGDEMTEALERAAAAAGLVAVFGASDDLTQFRGAIHAEMGWGELLFDVEGEIPERDDRWTDGELLRHIERKRRALKLTALWCAEPGISWTYKTDIPHAIFEVFERGDLYCRGIVFNLPPEGASTHDHE